MSAKWKWNTISIYVTDEDTSRAIKRAEILKLDNTESSYHFFGSGSRKITIKGLVIGTTDRDAIWSDAINDVARTLTTPYESLTNCKINGEPKFSTVKYSGGVIDGTTYSTSSTPLFTVDMEVLV